MICFALQIKKVLRAYEKLNPGNVNKRKSEIKFHFSSIKISEKSCNVILNHGTFANNVFKGENNFEENFSILVRRQNVSSKCNNNDDVGLQLRSIL